jgi:hypothetical protein
MALLLAAPLPQNRLADLRSQYHHETDPIRRAKIVRKLGTAEFEELRHHAEAGNFSEALRLLGDYRDEVLATHKMLDSTGVDAEQHPAGFKELQISVRESLRQLNEVLLTIPPEWKMGFEDIRKELDAANKRLILELFPRQPGHSSKKEVPKS